MNDHGSAAEYGKLTSPVAADVSHIYGLELCRPRLTTVKSVTQEAELNLMAWRRTLATWLDCCRGAGAAAGS